MPQRSPFRHARTVTFGECDPAGVVYFPRYFDWFHQAMEAWFGEALGLPYAQVLERHGFPSAHAEADYKRPCRPGERLTVELRVGELGGSSLRLDFRVVGADLALRATGLSRVVMIGLQPGAPDWFRPVRIPEDLRARIEAFGVGEAPAGAPGT